MDVWDMTRCLGILLDNAVEAAAETETPWVEIVLLAQGDGLSLRARAVRSCSISPAPACSDSPASKFL